MSISGTVEAALPNDSVVVLQVYDGTVLMKSQMWKANADPTTENATNVLRTFAISVPLASGSHSISVRATTYSGTDGTLLFPVTVSASRAVSQIMSLITDLMLSDVDVNPTGNPSPSTPPPSSLPGVVVNELSYPEAGTLPGNLSVDNSGAATYSVDLAVPPGTAGMQPQLSLNYSSNGSNGMVGMGWTLGGLSTIHRCAQTIAQDGTPSRIGFTNTDRLCLDGVRLLRNGSVAGGDVNANYWANPDGAQYRTEIEGFARITRQKNGGFKVELKDGRIQYYGIDSNSAIPAQGRTDGQPLLWALSRTEDRSGNYMTATYSQDANTGEYAPKQIRYGGNANAATNPDLAVNFEYSGRADAQVQYMGGSHNDMRSLLTHIRTYINTMPDGSSGTLVRDHEIHYFNSISSGRSLVDWMQVCADGKCLPKTIFKSGQEALAYRETSPVQMAMLDDMTGKLPSRVEGDFDGDGIPDQIFAQATIWCPDPSCVYIPTDDGKGNENEAQISLTGTLDVYLKSGKVQKQLVFPGKPFPKNAKHIEIADLDGNGLDDVLVGGAIV